MAIHLGLYTQEETKQPEFYDAPFRLHTDFDHKAFWREHSSDEQEFVNTKSKARYWIRLSWRILSLVLSTSFFGRQSNTDRVYEKDMFVLWSLHVCRPANVAVYLASGDSFLALQRARLLLTALHLRWESLLVSPQMTHQSTVGSRSDGGSTGMGPATLGEPEYTYVVRRSTPATGRNRRSFRSEAASFLPHFLSFLAVPFNRKYRN
ncbi:unnamed protein product [Cuscuta campestris]|uniref:Uncharacterized protein n=1 Tax=Cuscuta campestris TaxID=132261 RepID=A0A484L765_9ASTE|nr:unnamed protein product [Cuscuta campestris]